MLLAVILFPLFCVILPVEGWILNSYYADTDEEYKYDGPAVDGYEDSMQNTPMSGSDYWSANYDSLMMNFNLSGLGLNVTDKHSTLRFKLLQRFMRNPFLQQANFEMLPITVRIKLVPIKIQDLTERNETWLDHRLGWNPAHYAGLQEVVVPARTIWAPDIAILNSVSDLYHVVRDKRFEMKIQNDGKVWWHPTGIVRTSCKLFLRYYPFDQQRCRIVFESPTLDVRFMNLTLRNQSKPVDTRMFVSSETWEVLKFAGRNLLHQVGTNTVFSRVEFLIHMQRANIFHLVNFILPSFVLSSIQILFFLLPATHPQRVGSTTTILLSVIVFQTVVVSQLPKTSTDVPLLSIYIFCVTIVSSLSVSASVLIARFVEDAERNRPVPLWLRRIAHPALLWAKLKTRLKNEPRPLTSQEPTFISDGANESPEKGNWAPLAHMDSVFKLDETTTSLHQLSKPTPANNMAKKPPKRATVVVARSKGPHEVVIDMNKDSGPLFRPLFNTWSDVSRVVDLVLMTTAVLMAVLSPFILFIVMPSFKQTDHDFLEDSLQIP